MQACGLGWISSKCIFLTRTASNKRYIKVTSIGSKLGRSACDGIIGAHPFTGCDSTSAFNGQGTACDLWLVHNDATFCSAMASLGKSLHPPEEVFTSCEKATCILYNFNARSKKLTSPSTYSVNEMRAIMFTSGTSDPSKLPPCKDALRKKVQRANYQAYINRSCIQQKDMMPSPHGHGWIVSDDIQIDWMDMQPAPSTVLALMWCGCKTGCTSNKCRCKKNGLRCTGICTCSTECENQSRDVDVLLDEDVPDGSPDSPDIQEPNTDSDSDTDTEYYY